MPLPVDAQHIVERYRELDDANSPQEVRIIAALFLDMARDMWPPHIEAFVQVFRTMAKTYRTLGQPLLAMVCDTATEDLLRFIKIRLESFKQPTPEEVPDPNQ